MIPQLCGERWDVRAVWLNAAGASSPTAGPRVSMPACPTRRVRRVCCTALHGRRRRVLAVPLCAWRWATPVLTAFPAASHLPRPLRCLPSGAPCQIGWECCGALGEVCRNVDNTSGGECGPACTVFKPSGAACNPAADCCVAQSETCNDKGDGPKCQIP